MNFNTSFPLKKFIYFIKKKIRLFFIPKCLKNSLLTLLVFSSFEQLETCHPTYSTAKALNN